MPSALAQRMEVPGLDGPFATQSCEASEALQRMRDRNLYPLQHATILTVGTTLTRFQRQNQDPFVLVSTQDGIENRVLVEAHPDAWRLQPSGYVSFEWLPTETVHLILQAETLLGQSMGQALRSTGASGGLVYDFVRRDRKHQVALGGSPLLIGAALHVGYQWGAVEVATVRLEPFGSQVVTDEGLEANADDPLYLRYSNWTSRFGIRSSYRLYDALMLTAEGGFQFMPFSDMEVTEGSLFSARDNAVDVVTSPNVFRVDQLTAFGTQPQAAQQGVYVSVGLALTITEHMLKY